MNILIPTCRKYLPIAQITRTLLDRFWPSHPEVETAIDADDIGWVGNLARALRSHDDPLRLLLLDDYGVCAPARAGAIATAAEALERDPSASVYCLSWQPARRREPYPGSPDAVELHGTPILLQAAIWRTSALLELAREMNPRTTASGFERLATQRLKQSPMRILAANIPEPPWIGGEIIDGFDKSNWPIPYHNLMHRGEPNLMYEPFLHEQGLRFPSRGLGDTIARVTHATGIDRLMPEGCGCSKRREMLNGTVPYQ